MSYQEPNTQTNQLAELIAYKLECKFQPQLTAIHDSVVKLEEQTRTHEEAADRHERVLYGENGSDGLITKVSYLSRVANTASWIVGIIVGIIISTAVATFIYLAQTHPLP